MAHKKPCVICQNPPFTREWLLVADEHQGPVSLTVFHRDSNSMEISFYSHLDYRKKNLYMSRQLCCRGMCKNLLQSHGQQQNYSKANFPSNGPQYGLWGQPGRNGGDGLWFDIYIYIYIRCPSGILATLRVRDSLIWIQPEGSFALTPHPVARWAKNYAIIIQFVLPLTTFYRSGAQKSNVYKQDAFVTSWRFHNRAWQPQHHDRLPETSGTLWIHRGALTNQTISSSKRLQIWFPIYSSSFHVCMDILNHFPTFSGMLHKCYLVYISLISELSLIWSHFVHDVHYHF